MTRILVSVLALAGTLFMAQQSSAQDWIWQAQRNHGNHHADLDHREFHRYLYHNEAHRYPMTWRQHGQLHDQLDHSRYHDQLEHNWAHRNGAYYPQYRYYGSSSGLYYQGRGFSIYFGF